MPETKPQFTITPQQVANEFTEGQDFLRARKLRQVRQLVLMNNLRRGDANIASTLLFTYFQRVISNLYDPTQSQDFVGSEDSDYKRTEALKKLAASDNLEVDKNTIDYDWLWDTGFFGAGYLETLHFDKKRKLMVPSVLNPLYMIYDPYRADTQRWRYYGKWLDKSGYELKELIDKKLITGVERVADIPRGLDSELWDYKVRREAAKEGTAPSESSTSTTAIGDIFQIYEHFTHNENGEKVLVWTDKTFAKVLREIKLDLRDDPDNPKKSKWPIIKKEMYREPHSSLPISIPDIVEDKHRAESALLNLMYIAAKDEADPIYIYDQDRVVDTDQLMQREIEQHIAVKNPEGMSLDNILKPANTKAAATNSLLQFLNLLEGKSSEPLGTTQVSPAVTKGKKTATHDAILQQVADLTASLQAKILMQADKEYYSHWYQRYMRHKKDGDQKIVAMTSVNGTTFETIDLDNIKTKYPPRVLIKSGKEASFKQMVDQRNQQTILPMIAKLLQPSSLMNYLKYVFLPKFVPDSSTIEQMIPNSLSEIKARQENDTLAKDELVQIDKNDDDSQHIYVHYQAKKTASTWAHIFGHEQQLAQKLEAQKQQQALLAEKAAQGGQPDQGGDQNQPTDQTPQKTQKPKPPRKGAAGPARDQTAPLKQALEPVLSGGGSNG